MNLRKREGIIYNIEGGIRMARTAGSGIQSFKKIIENEYFSHYKTSFIKEWWKNRDDVTLITRPRRFGKILMMDMLISFFGSV